MNRHVKVLEAVRSAFEGIPAPCEEREALDAAIALMRAPVEDGRTYAETCAYSRGYHAGKKAAMQEAGKS